MTIANLQDSSAKVYDYLTTDDRKSYCLSTTSLPASANTSFTRTQSTGDPVQGRCVQNLILNTSVENGTSGMGASYGQGGVGTVGQNTTSPYQGANILRMTWSTAPTNVTTGGLWSYSNSATGLNAAGKVYTASAYIRNSWAGGTFSLNLVGYSSTSTVTGEIYGSTVTVPAGAWTKVTATWTAPANTDYFVARVRQGGGTMASIGSTMDSDGFMLVEGATSYSYGGIGVQNWVSKTGANNAVSFGPAVVQ